MQLIITEIEGSTTVSIHYDKHNVATPFGGSTAFTSPLSVQDLDDLRFYLEDYAQLPVGEFLQRGERVEKEKLAAWGEALYREVFGGDEARHTAYVQAKTALANGEAVEVVIRSNDPQFLGLPWERPVKTSSHSGQSRCFFQFSVLRSCNSCDSCNS